MEKFIGEFDSLLDRIESNRLFFFFFFFVERESSLKYLFSSLSFNDEKNEEISFLGFVLRSLCITFNESIPFDEMHFEEN